MLEQFAQLRHFRGIMDASADNDHSESRAERVARYWKNAEMAFDRSSTAPLDQMRRHYRQMARMWAELAEELERKPPDVVQDGGAQRKRQ